MRATMRLARPVCRRAFARSAFKSTRMVSSQFRAMPSMTFQSRGFANLIQKEPLDVQDMDPDYQYASAIFQEANAEGRAFEVYEDLSRYQKEIPEEISDIFQHLSVGDAPDVGITRESVEGKTNAFDHLFEDPNVKVIGVPEEGFVQKAIESSDIGEYSQKIVKAIVDTNQWPYFGQIVSFYRQIVDHEMNLVNVVVTTARPLKEYQREALREKLVASADSGLEISITEKLNPSILGGFDLQIGSNKVVTCGLQRTLDEFIDHFQKRTAGA